jgi:glycosyltransferase involved in cell wall biosynthesis
MHASILGFVAGGGLSRAEVLGRDVLEVGSGDYDGSVRPIVEAFGPASYLGTDATEGPGVDRVVACERLVAEFGPDSFDVVVCTEVLQYVEDWAECLSNMFTVLRPGGTLLVTARRPGFPPNLPAQDEVPPTWTFTVGAFAEILRRVNFSAPIVCTDPDPAHVGVFVKARKRTEPEFTGAAGFGSHRFHDVEGVAPAVRPLSVLGLPHQADGSTYYRMFLPLSCLQQASGHRVMIPRPDVKFLPEPSQLADVDVLVMQRPAGPAGMQCWSAWKPHTRLVYEVDDDLLRVDPSGLPHLHDDRVRDTIRFCLQLSDLITVSTPYLAEQYRQFNDRVVVLPNYVDEKLLAVERPRRERLTLGWAGGSSHLADWATVAAPAVRATLDARPEIDMHFMGVDFSPMLGDARARCRFTTWDADVSSYYHKIDFDVGLAPLGDSDFNRSKSYVRALEMASLGIPVVASDVEPYREFVIDGVTGYLVRTEQEWTARLAELVGDAEAREEMGRKAKEHAAAFTIQGNWVKWRDAYEAVAGYRRAS